MNRMAWISTFTALVAVSLAGTARAGTSTHPITNERVVLELSGMG